MNIEILKKLLEAFGDEHGDALEIFVETSDGSTVRAAGVKATFDEDGNPTGLVVLR
ncbi:MAG: hypothetical protein J6K20_15190 [Thermoguttaceae bacterium]|nr:hypothetical protein [Thermoguttaceae bacterium]MBQ7813982.1 hypothetical protein [Thermoguttaceae bacterium]MBQ9128408.1 hypothetical protein [Thermoguttaceae bacterium]